MKEIKIELHLCHPLDEAALDLIYNADLDHTDRIFFHTKNGKEVCFVKEEQDTKEMNQ